MTKPTLQTLASVVVILTAASSVAYYIYDLEKRVERLETEGVPPQIQTMPPGAILPYVGKDDVGVEAAPDGWVLCGESDTPNLDGRFLLGTNTFAQVRQEVGSDRHSHRVAMQTSGERNGALASSPPELADNHSGRNWDHDHNIEGNTEQASHMPPSVKVMFLCKVR